MRTLKILALKLVMLLLPIPAGVASAVLGAAANWYFDALHEIAKIEGSR